MNLFLPRLLMKQKNSVENTTSTITIHVMKNGGKKGRLWMEERRFHGLMNTICTYHNNMYKKSLLDLSLFIVSKFPELWSEKRVSRSEPKPLIAFTPVWFMVYRSNFVNEMEQKSCHHHYREREREEAEMIVNIITINGHESSFGNDLCFQATENRDNDHMTRFNLSQKVYPNFLSESKEWRIKGVKNRKITRKRNENKQE